MRKSVHGTFGITGDENYRWWEHTRFTYIECYHVKHPLQWELQFETQWFNEAWLLRNGQCEIWSGEQHVIAEAGDLVVIPYGSSRVTRSVGSVPMEVSGFHFSIQSEHYQEVTPLMGLPLCVKNAGQAKFVSLFDRLVTETVEHQPGYNLAAPGLAQLILGEIVRASRPAGETADAFAQYLHSNLRQVVSDDIADVLDYIHRFYSRHTLNLQELAATAHLSVSYLSRKFKATQNITPMGYVRVFRLHRSRDQLLNLNNDKSIAQIAFDCGFDDPSYFGREFKSEFGCTPSEFRKKSIQSQ